MNINRIIWITTIALFGIVGLMLGWLIGSSYVDVGTAHMGYDLQGGALVKGPLRYAVTLTLSGSMGVLMARIGSWCADRFLIPGLGHLHQLSAADRVLVIIGTLLGLLFGVLITLPLPNEPWYLWLPIKLCGMAVTAALGMALLQGMRSEMLRVFPQLEAPSGSGGAPMGCTPKLLDTNVIIDGRIGDLCKTGFVEGQICVPRFVLEEVQYIADSADSMRRARGRRGLDVLNAMREQTARDSTSSESMPLVRILNDIPASVQKIESVDSKLIFLAKEMGGSIVTNDFNLNKVAALQGVQVLNINELAQALKPVVLPGEEMNLTIVKEGKEPGQGVGYLEDGTMVVVGDGQKHVGETCKVVIASVIQTLAGKMIFADTKGLKGAGDDLFHPGNGAISSSGVRKGYDSDDLSHRSGGGPRRKSKP